MMEKIAFVGNPNCGKTSLFNAISGLNQRVGNFPGVTVDRKDAVITLSPGKSVRVIDLPGTQSLYPSAEDERVTCQVLWDTDHPDHPDRVIVVVDATQLRRGLLLCSQVMDLGFPTLVVLNMVDLVEKQDTQIDAAKLSKEMKIQVLEVSALKKRGIEELKQAMGQPIGPVDSQVLNIPSGFQAAIEDAKGKLGTSNTYLAFQSLLVPEEFDSLANSLPQNGSPSQELDSKSLISNEILVRYDKIDNLLEGVIRPAQTRSEQFTNRLDRILIHRIWGYLIFIGLLLLIFQALFSWSTYPMDLIDAGFAALGSQVAEWLPDTWWSSLLTDGVIAGIGGIVIFIPQIAFLFFFIALLEESGYMSRVVFLMDRIMRPFGFSGKSVIPLIGGMACAIPSIMMARSIPNRRERLITILVTPLMSCSARIPVYVLLIAMFVPATSILGIFNLQGLTMMGLYLLGFLAALVFAFVFKIMMKLPAAGVFVSELPLYRSPRWGNVATIMYQKSRTFVVEAGKIIFLISIVLWFLASYGPEMQWKP